MMLMEYLAMEFKALANKIAYWGWVNYWRRSKMPCAYLVGK